MTTKKKTKTSPESIVREIKERTRCKFTAEEKIRYYETINNVPPSDKFFGRDKKILKMCGKVSRLINQHN